MTCNNLKKAEEQCRIIRELSRGGVYRVVFVSYPQLSDVFEFVARAERGGVRYVNVDAKPGANISKLL